MTLPTLLPGANELLAAFWELSTDRQVGWKIGPLPASSIDRYCTAAGFDADESASFRGAMRAMDKTFRDVLDSRADDSGFGKPAVAANNNTIHSRPMNPQLFDALFLPKKK